MIRPQARATLWRFRQVILGAVVTLPALNWLVTGYGLTRWLAGFVALIGLALMIEGLRRARLAGPNAGLGPGVVEVDERQIAWFAAEHGGAVSVDALVRVELRMSRHTGPAWLLVQGDGTALMVPGDAVGAERIPDALASLPGLDLNAAARAMSLREPGSVVLWRAGAARLRDKTSG